MVCARVEVDAVTARRWGRHANREGADRVCQGCARVGLDGRSRTYACASQITVATRKVGVLAVSEGRAYAFLGCV